MSITDYITTNQNSANENSFLAANRYTPAQLRQQAINIIKAICPSFVDSPNSPENNLLDEVIIVLSLGQDLSLAMLSAIAYTYAPPDIVKNIGSSVGVEQKQKGFSMVDLVFTGSPFTVIPAGTKCTSSDGTVIAVTSVFSQISQASGTVTISAVLSQGGSQTVDAGVITTIVNGITGVTVTNPAASTVNQEGESDDVYAKRIQDAFRCNRVGTSTQMMNQIKMVAGVNPRAVAIAKNTKQESVVNATLTGGTLAPSTAFTLPFGSTVEIGSTSFTTQYPITFTSTGQQISTTLNSEGFSSTANNVSGVVVDFEAQVSNALTTTSSINTLTPALNIIVQGGDAALVANAILKGGLATYNAQSSPNNQFATVELEFAYNWTTTAVSTTSTLQPSFTFPANQEVSAMVGTATVTAYTNASLTVSANKTAIVIANVYNSTLIASGSFTNILNPPDTPFGVSFACTNPTPTSPQSPIISETVKDGGDLRYVEWTQPYVPDLQINVYLQLVSGAGSQAQTSLENTLTNSIVNYMNSLQVGSNVNISSLNFLVCETLVNNALITNPSEIYSLTFKILINGIVQTPVNSTVNTQNQYSNGYVIMQFDELIEISSSNVVIEVS